MANGKSQFNPDLIDYLYRTIAELRRDPLAYPDNRLTQLQRLVSFDHYAITGLDIEGLHFGRGAILRSNMPEAYLSAYIGEDLASADPLVQLASPINPIISPDTAGPSRDPKHKLGQVIRRFDIAPRTAITLWNSRGPYGGGVFTRKQPFTQDEIELLATFVPALHREAARPVLEALSRCIGLSRSELQCIRLAAQGLTSEDIAEETPLTRETVNTYLKSATKKLKARNRTQAVVHALRIGIID